MAAAPDGARAWVVAFAACVIHLITAGIFRAQGILFVSFISEYNVNRIDASLPFSIRPAIRNLLGPVVGILGQKYGISIVVISGGILGAISSIFCAFAIDILWITIGWGVINGIAIALITVLPQVVIGQYFVRHRTTATGLSLSGGCFGSFVFPAILEILLQYYGLEGTFFILGGLFLHIIPAAMIFKKPPWLLEKRAFSKKGIETFNDKNNCTVNNHKNEKPISKSCNDKSNQTPDYDRRHFDFDNHNITLSARHFGYLNSAEGMTQEMQRIFFYRGNMTASVNNIELNYRTIKANSNYIFDVDLDYLKRMSDIVFQMFSMEIPNMEMTYRAILLEVEHDNIWHPEKEEVMKEIENICLQIEKAFEMNQGSDNIIEANGLYMKRTLLNGVLSLNKKTQSLRAVKKHLRTYKERGLLFGKIRSAPNMSNIYNELARKDYIISKMRQLNNCNEIRIISLLCQYNPRDVLRVLFHIRSLYKLYSEIEPTENCESHALSESSDNKEESEDEDWIEIKHKCSTVEDKYDSEDAFIPELKNSFKHHINEALILYKCPIFLLIGCCRIAYFLSFIPFMTIIVDFALDKGLPEEDGKYLIGAVAVGDLVGRLGLGWITDRGYANLPRYMFTAMTMQGVSIISLPLMHSRWSLLACVSLFGMLIGSLFVRHPVLIAKYIDTDKQSIGVGCMEFIAGVFCIIIPVYIGFFRDNIGSYNPIFYINGGISILVAVCWLFEPYIAKKRDIQQEH